MIGSENGRVQIICIRAGMKEIDDGANLGSTIADAPPTVETAARRFSFTGAAKELNQTPGWIKHRLNMLKSAARPEAVLRILHPQPLHRFDARTRGRSPVREAQA
jgi:hypothetical protein